MRRRALLSLSASALSLSIAGCASGQGSDSTTGSTQTTQRPTAGSTPTTQRPTTRASPDVSCDNVSHPTPPEQDHEDAVQPVEYPGQPPEPLYDEAAIEYVTRFETAYQRNRAIVEKDRLVRFSSGATGSRTFDAPPGAAVVRLEIAYGGKAGDEDEWVHFDSPRLFVSYYVDPTLVVRAGPTGTVDVGDELVPSPWDDGEPVACFDE